MLPSSSYVSLSSPIFPFSFHLFTLTHTYINTNTLHILHIKPQIFKTQQSLLTFNSISKRNESKHTLTCEITLSHSLTHSHIHTQTLFLFHHHHKLDLDFMTRPIVVEFAERFAYQGLASNLIQYLTNVLNEPITQAAKDVNTWVGASSLFPLLGGFIADSYLGRFNTILLSSLIYLVVSKKTISPLFHHFLALIFSLLQQVQLLWVKHCHVSLLPCLILAKWVESNLCAHDATTLSFCNFTHLRLWSHIVQEP